MIKICRVCKENKQEEDFPKRTKRPDGSIIRATICKLCQRQVSKKHYKENKDMYRARDKKKNKELFKFVREYKENSKCERCGISGKGMPESMDFKHKETEIKKGRISKLVQFSKKNIIMEEIKKCNLYCANCQRIVEVERKHGHHKKK